MSELIETQSFKLTTYPQGKKKIKKKNKSPESSVKILSCMYLSYRLNLFPLIV